MKMITRIERPCYSLATDEKNENAELTLYGEIVSERPYDYWQGKVDDNPYIVESEIISDISSLAGCKSLHLRINSLGGDTVVSLTIHNRLREMAANGTKITCTVDGAAMSGGSIIMCAADTIKAARSSLIMIHKCSSFYWDRMNADNLKKEAARLEVYDKAILECYKRRSSCNEDELLRLMSETCYMTGGEAHEKGFVDEVIEDAVKISACAYDKSLLVNGYSLPLRGFPMPENIPVITERTTPPDNNKNLKNGGKKTMAKDLSELMKENPELAAKVQEEITAKLTAELTAKASETTEVKIVAERKRLEEIDQMAHLFDEETVAAAKYGDKACTAQEMCYRAAQKAAESGQSFMTNIKADAKSSGLEKVATIDVPDAITQGQADVKEQSLSFMDEYLNGKEK